MFFWMLLGAFIALAIVLIFVKLKSNLNWISWLTSIGAILMGAFTLAWFFASWVENEMQAAGMGLLCFGAITLILVFITRKLITSPAKTVE